MEEDQRGGTRELKQWLQMSNCQQYLSKFVDNGITYDLLPELDTASLKEMGISKLGDRLRLELAIEAMKAEQLKDHVNVNELYNLMNLQISADQTSPDSKLNTPSVQDLSDPATLTPPKGGLLPSNNLSANLLAHSKDSNKSITFILQDGSTKRVNVTGCFNAQSIKRKILRKLGLKQQHEGQYDTYVYTSDPEGVNLLFDVELVTICYSPERLEKHRIILCAKDDFPSEAAIEASKRITSKYERFMTGRSSNPTNSVPEDSTLTADNLNQYHIPAQHQQNKRPTLRNFFGQRPPSELISSNLAEYFPDTRQKDLEATVRNSVRYSVRLSRKFHIPHGIGNSNVSGNTSTSSVNNRGSVVSSMFPTPSIYSDQTSNGSKRVHSGRTIGDVMVNNITAIGEAVNSGDNLSVFSKPPSVISGGTGPANDAKSIYSNNSGNRHFSPSQRRISIAASFNDLGSNNRYSRIELVSVDSDSDESDDFLAEYGYEDDFEALDTLLEDGPKNWLKGARIGAGSFGVVYLGMNPLTGELMAVKQISLPTKNSLEDLQKSMLEQQREMMLLKELNHENIVRYYGASTDEINLNIFLEYVPGGSVQSMLQSYGPFEEPLIRNFVRQVLIGLNYLHGKDIIHRDIKGANILIDIKGTVKIGDFGISKRVSSSDSDNDTTGATTAGPTEEKKGGRRASLQGSVYWMAPEVVKQTAYTKKADIWSVGCLIVEMFTGKHPYPQFSQMQAIFKIGTHIRPLIPEWCTMEGTDFLNKTFELNYENRPEAIDLLGEPFLNPLIMLKQ